MTLIIHDAVEQGSDEWYALRCGLLTASEMKLLITPAKLEYANNDNKRAHLFELVSQRITKYVEPTYISNDMLRGTVDEIAALDLYQKKRGEGKRVGFITNDKWGFKLGYSPDLLFGDDGQVEVKSRCQYLQLKTILAKTAATEHLIQINTGLLVSERNWCDYVSYCGGMRMPIYRIYGDKAIQDAILKAAAMFEGEAQKMVAEYEAIVAAEGDNMPETERVNYDDEIQV